MGTRREDLEEALGAIEEQIGEPAPQPEPEPAPTPENISAEPAEQPEGERVRDDSGRFAKKPEAPNPEAIAAVEVEPKPVEVERPEPPRSWKADKRAVWDKLDPDTAAYINQREQEQARGFEEFRASRDPIYREVEPYFDVMRQRGASPEAVTRDLFHTYKLLSTGDEATRLQTIVNVAHAVGIPLANWLQQGGMPQQAQQYLDPQVMEANQRARQAEFQMSNLQAQQQADLNAQARAQVEAFAQTHPYIDELGPEMQRLLQAGLATDLDSAYSKALRLNEKLFEQSQAQQRQTADQQRRVEADKAAKAAKANAVSTRSATPGTAANGGAPKGRRAALEDAFDSMATGRI